MSRLVTGIKPTGAIHIGNYFGAMRPLLELQKQHECFVFIADLHALNQVQEPATLRADILQIAKAYLAVGIDPQRVILFQQSALPNGELAIILEAITSMGLMERAHAYKDAVAKEKPMHVGLFTYPVLMAADILLYQGEVVPVGQDQQQHLEMAREIAQRFNHLFGETFALPQPVFGTAESVVGLDGRKMSKSYGNTIGLFEPADELQRKVMRITTDSKRPEEPKDPDTCAVVQVHRLVGTPELLEDIERRYREGGISYKESKDLLFESLNTFLTPLRDKMASLDDATVIHVLAEGAQRARQVADATLDAVREHAGLKLAAHAAP